MSRRILLVEDEPGLVLTLTDRLLAEGYEVESEGDAVRGLARGSTGTFDAILLDVMLPGGSGFDVCRTLRQRGIQTPILMLTARGQVVDKCRRTETRRRRLPRQAIRDGGAARAYRGTAAAWRRAGVASDRLIPFRFGDISIDFRKAEVTKAGEPLELSAREFQLLQYFIEHRGATLSRDELLNEVWGYNAMPSTRTVDVHVAWLRQKIRSQPAAPAIHSHRPRTGV